MKDKGYEKAFALLGGTPVWQNAGYPMESSAPKEQPKNSNSNTKVAPPKGNSNANK